MLALPPAPAPARPRQKLIATSLVVTGGVALFAGLLGVYLNLRDAAGGTTKAWVPKGVVMSNQAPTLMLVTMVGASVVAQWAVYAAARDIRRDLGAATALLVVFGFAVVNAQAYMWKNMHISIDKQGFAVLVFTITGTFVVALLAGIVFALLEAFRGLGGRASSTRHEGISAMALYWHFLTVAFAAVWFVIYINK
jgi:cytochrome c oxidase subunit 3